jgi:pyruvate kinase
VCRTCEVADGHVETSGDIRDRIRRGRRAESTSRDAVAVLLEFPGPWVRFSSVYRAPVGALNVG